MPPTRPISALKARLAATDAKNAPIRNWPSIAMLMTPARSHRQPASAPKISGVASRMVPGIGLMKATEKEPLWSVYGQTMKPAKNASPTSR